MDESPIIVILVNYFSRLQLPITNLLCGMPVDAKIRLFCSLAVNQKNYMIKQLIASQISRLLANAHCSGRRLLPYGKQYDVMWAEFVYKT